MATPRKPWEGSNKNFSSSMPIPPRTPSGSISDSGSARGGEMSKKKPVVPARPNSSGTVGTFSNYSPFSPGYGYGGYSMGYGGYGGYNAYGGYGGYRPFNMYGQNNEDNMMIRQAEERTRTAFQSVESVVGAVASISMMLESTYVAVYSCFRALIGVAQSFSSLKDRVWSIITAIALLRRLKLWLKWLLRILRLRNYSPTEEAWDNSTLSQPESLESSQRLWPAVMFFTIIVGVPWLLWRLLQSVVSDSSEGDVISQIGSEGGTALALYDFTAERSNELSISTGDELSIAPRTVQPNIPGWILVGKDRKSGLVPANHIEIYRRNTSATPSSEPSPELLPFED